MPQKLGEIVEKEGSKDANEISKERENEDIECTEDDNELSSNEKD